MSFNFHRYYSRPGRSLDSIWRSCWWRPLLRQSDLPALIYKLSVLPKLTWETGYTNVLIHIFNTFQLQDVYFLCWKIETNIILTGHWGSWGKGLHWAWQASSDTWSLYQVTLLLLKPYYKLSKMSDTKSNISSLFYAVMLEMLRLMLRWRGTSVKPGWRAFR